MNTCSSVLADLYIASCARDGGIYHAHLSPDGIIDIRDKILLDRPMYLIRQQNRLHIVLLAPFATSSDSGYAALDIRPDGSLAPPDTLLSTHGVEACHLAAIGQQIFIVNYTSGSVLRLPDTLRQHSGHSIHPQRQQEAHPHYVSPTPDGKALCVVDLGLDQLVVYDAQLEQVISRTALPPGSGCRHLTFSADGALAFCANELASTVSVLRYETGRFTLLDTYPTLPEGYTGQSTCAAIRATAHHVYVSNRGHDSITSYTLQGEQLCRQRVTASGGCSPQDFTLCGPYLLCANANSHTVTVFARRGGELSPVSSLSLSTPYCIVASER